MTDHVNAYGEVERRVRTWAETRSDVHGVLAVGSRARADRPADEYSDLDLTLFADEPDRLIDTDDWLHEIGPVTFSFVEGTAVGGWRERRAVSSRCSMSISRSSRLPCSNWISRSRVPLPI